MFENMSQIPSSLDGEFLKKPVRKCVFEFGLVIGGFLCLVALYRILRYGEFDFGVACVAAAGLFVVLSKFMPLAIFQIWRLWMLLALAMSRVMTPLILVLMWVVVVIPTGLILNLFGKKLLDVSFRDEKSKTYFKTREAKENNFDLLKRQF
jgi:hypothetical protein